MTKSDRYTCYLFSGGIYHRQTLEVLKGSTCYYAIWECNHGNHVRADLYQLNSDGVMEFQSTVFRDLSKEELAWQALVEMLDG